MSDFSVKKRLNLKPYSLCLIDVSNGLPVNLTLKNYGLDNAHRWKIDELEFYSELRLARQHALRKIFSQLNLISIGAIVSDSTSAQSKILMWQVEQQIAEEKALNDLINRVLEKRALIAQESMENSALKKIGYDDAPDADSYYAKYSSH